jgi:hypothetical protein
MTTLTGTYVQDIFVDIWHLWTRPGNATDCGLRVENAWLVTRLAEPAPGRYCMKCFNDSAVRSAL